MAHFRAFRTLGMMKLPTFCGGQLQITTRVLGLLTGPPKSIHSIEQKRHAGSSFYQAQMGQPDMGPDFESSEKKEEFKESRLNETLYKM